MKIAYRRLSGAIALTKNEIGTRGLWLEKRLALVKFLQSRKHTVDYIGRMTKASKSFEKKIKFDHELLIIEFGSNNTLSYGDDIQETLELCNNTNCHKIFICDDPDLPFLWSKVNASEFSAWYNCLNPPKIKDVKVYDFPFSSLQKPISIAPMYNKSKLVYIGRPFGREKEIEQLIKGKVPWMPYGDKKHWEQINIAVGQAPSQSVRGNFYNKSIGSIVLYDQKHAKLGWRTGRAFHSALSGCPAIVFGGNENLALKPFLHCETTKAIIDSYERWKNPEARKREIEKQIELILQEKKIAMKVLENFGL